MFFNTINYINLDILTIFSFIQLNCLVSWKVWIGLVKFAFELPLGVAEAEHFNHLSSTFS